VWQQVFSAATAATAAAPMAAHDTGSIDRPASMQELGFFVQPRLQPLLMRYLCDASIPRTVAELLSFPKRLSSILREFEQQCLQRGIMRVESNASEQGSSVGPISAFLASLTPRFEHRVRERVLHATKLFVVNNGFETKKFNQSRVMEAQEREAAFPSIFYSPVSGSPATAAAAAVAAVSPSAASAVSPPTSDAQAHTLLMHHSHSIFSRATSYAVSQSAFAFVHMLYELYFEMLSARHAHAHVGERTFLALFESLREAVQLYAAIAPVYRARELEAVLHLSFMFHNDCTFIAKHLTTLDAHFNTVQQQDGEAETTIAVDASSRTSAAGGSSSTSVSAADDSTASSSISSSCAPPLQFADLAPPLSQQGSHFFLLQLSRQRTLVSDLAEAFVRFFADLDDRTAFQSTLQAAKQTLHQLTSIEKTWNQLMGGQHNPIPPEYANMGATVAVNAGATPAAASASSATSAPSSSSSSAAVSSSSLAASSSSSSSSAARHNGWPLNLGLLLESLTARLVGLVLDKADISVEGGQQH